VWPYTRKSIRTSLGTNLYRPPESIGSPSTPFAPYTPPDRQRVGLGGMNASGACAVSDPPFSSLTTIINDWDDHVSSTGDWPWVVGTYGACSDSHGDHGEAQDDKLDFHHDGGSTFAKGRVAATYAPTVECGCYEIYEWHPGGGRDCSKYMPHHFPVSIRTAGGVIATRTINQAKRGRRWNSLGTFELDGGLQQIVLSNEGSDSCEATSCYWVADAFKLEWRGMSCDEIVRPVSTHDGATSASPPFGVLFYVVLGLLAVSLLGWAASVIKLRRWLRDARAANPKVVYLPPGTYPLHVQNPGGDSALTIPIPISEATARGSCGSESASDSSSRSAASSTRRHANGLTHGCGGRRVWPSRGSDATSGRSGTEMASPTVV
jgi:hypothetical protein